MPISVQNNSLDGVVVLETAVYRDDRGSFRELFKQSEFEAATGLERQWVQDNHASSGRNVLRGIHYQTHPQQGKLVQCVVGSVYDVAVDLRRASPSFGRWEALVLTEENGRQVWIPEGFGHGYLVLSDTADVLYKVTAEHNPDGYGSVAWDDPDLGIDWPLGGPPILSEKDRLAPRLGAAQLFD